MGDGSIKYMNSLSDVKKKNHLLKSIFHHNQRDQTKALSVFLVKSGSTGNHLLFRYPFELPGNTSITDIGDKDRRKNGLKPSLSRDNSRGSPSGESKAEMIANTYGVTDPSLTFLSTSDKLNSVIKSIIPSSKAVDDEISDDLFPPVITAPTIPESAVIDSQRGNNEEDDDDENIRIDPLILQVMSLSDQVLTDLFAVKASEICGQKFEVKINNMRFVGHPITMNSPDIQTLNIVFALKANSSHDIVNCYHEISHRLCIGLMMEESKNEYLTNETKNMLKLQHFDDHHEFYDDNYEGEMTVDEKVELDYKKKLFKLENLRNILETNLLAQTLKKVFDDITVTGTTVVLINNSSLISFCLPQKVHQLLRSNHQPSLLSSSILLPPIGPQEITKALELLRPFHGILLLTDYKELKSKYQSDMTRPSGQNKPSDTLDVICKLKATKTLHEVSKEVNLSLSRIFQVVSSLVYWGKASIIYPICLANVYTIHPLVKLSVHSKMISDFYSMFNSNLLQFLSFFEKGISVKKLKKLTALPNKILINQLIWLLRHQLLLQLHDYVYYIGYFPPSNDGKQSRNIYDSEDEDSYNPGHPTVASFTTGSESDVLDGDKSEMESLLDQDEELDQEERNSIMKLIVTRNVSHEHVTLFLKLKSKFDGHRHLEDIMFHENIDRQLLTSVIETFGELVVTARHEDRAVAMLSPYYHSPN